MRLLPYLDSYNQMSHAYDRSAVKGKWAPDGALKAGCAGCSSAVVLVPIGGPRCRSTQASARAFGRYVLCSLRVRSWNCGRAVTRNNTNPVDIVSTIARPPFDQTVAEALEACLPPSGGPASSFRSRRQRAWTTPGQQVRH